MWYKIRHSCPATELKTRFFYPLIHRVDNSLNSTPMSSGICVLSSVPMRREPTHRSEMVNQLLFGERWDCIREEDDWLLIRGKLDRYEGWIDRQQAAFEHVQREEGPACCTLDLVQSATSRDRHVLLFPGSRLPGFDGIHFRLLQEKFVYNGQATEPGPSRQPASFALKLARKFLGAPYLWGGRTPLGVDCSGLMQVVCSVSGMQLPRDATDQAQAGVSVDFVHQAQPGDLAFFDNAEGRIVHVGMLCAPGQILHASGKVRIDALDQQGIYNKEQRKYTHKLRFIKRLSFND